MSETLLVATITGTDDWLRSHLIRRLSTTGISAKDGGRGSSVLNGTDVLVVLPALFPLSASPSRDAGVAAAGISLGAVGAFNVSRVVLLSRVGASSGGGRYLSELAAVERMASAASPRTTIVRVTHPFGEADDPGPLASMLMNDQRPWQGRDPSVQPVAASNVVDVLEAAVDGRIKPGLVEVGGPVTMAMSSLSAHLQRSSLEGPGSGGRTGPRAPWARRPWRRSVDELLAQGSETNRKFAPPIPMQLRALMDVWPEKDL